MNDLENTDLATLEAVVETDKGDMVIRFRPDKAPNHVRNFLQLARQGFYDGLAFHRVIRGFMIQGGCPNTREGATGVPGTGGPGHTVDAEFNDLPHERGAVSMARGPDPDSAGSQFFIVHGEHADFLDGDYTVFGKVVDGLDVLDEIAAVEVGYGPGGERSEPSERVGIRRITIRQTAPGAGEPAGGDDGSASEDGGDGGGGPV